MTVTPGREELIASVASRLEGHSFALRQSEHHRDFAKKIVDEVSARLAAKPSDEGWQLIETCPKADYKSYYLFNELWEDGWSGVQRANWFDGVWIFDSGLSLTDCETKFNPVMWHPDTTPRPPSTTGEPKP